MGTSASSSGPRGGVPMVPPWVPDPSDVPQQAVALATPTPVDRKSVV